MNTTLYATLALGLALSAPAQTDGKTPPTPKPETDTFWTVEVSGVGG